jgi:hypothetical protein
LRDAQKQADTGKALVNDLTDITAGEIDQLYKIFKAEAQATESNCLGVYKAIVTAYYMGFSVGYEASKT